jgi:hypothetical protein
MLPMPKSEPAAAPSIIDGGGCKAPGVGGSLKSGGGALPGAYCNADVIAAF